MKRSSGLLDDLFIFNSSDYNRIFTANFCRCAGYLIRQHHLLRSRSEDLLALALISELKLGLID